MNKWVFLSVLVLVGCGRKLHVESDTSWSGAIGGDAGYSVGGSGNHVYDLDAGTVCWSFQKETTGGRLRAYSEETTLLIPSRSGDATTSAAYGIVTGCTD